MDWTRLSPGYLRSSAVRFLPLRLCVRFRFLSMRYLVKAQFKPGRESALVRAIDDKILGRGSVAGDEYLWDMEHARITADHAVTWVEVCFCATPLAEERPYWEEYSSRVRSDWSAPAQRPVAIRAWMATAFLSLNTPAPSISPRS
jgi:hypothetical protein